MVYRLHQSLGFRLSRAARIQERRLDADLKTLGLTRVTWCILLAVGNEGLTQPSEIAGFVGIDRTATSRAMRQMEANDLIERTTGVDDARTREVRLTPEGGRRLRLGEPMAVANNAAMAARLSEADLRDLKAMLNRLIEGAPALNKL